MERVAVSARVAPPNALIPTKSGPAAPNAGNGKVTFSRAGFEAAVSAAAPSVMASARVFARRNSTPTAKSREERPAPLARRFPGPSPARAGPRRGELFAAAPFPGVREHEVEDSPALSSRRNACVAAMRIGGTMHARRSGGWPRAFVLAARGVSRGCPQAVVGSNSRNLC